MRPPLTINQFCPFSKATYILKYNNADGHIINWQKIYLFVTHFIISISIERFLQTLCKSTTISQSHLSQRFIERNLLKEMMESEIWLNCWFFRVYQHFFISVGKCPREWIIASLQICIWLNQDRIVLLTAYWNTRKEG